MRKPELAAAIAARTNLSKSKAAEVLNALTDEIADAVSRNETVSLIGFGTFSQRNRSARTGKNPKTGAAIKIPASKTVGFKAGKLLKDAVNK
ncbi:MULTISPECIES: HU family DNA-binding protein [Hahella]|uniref:Bacterial nucleoid DNA-binding protein n=1 Tax=Hahella chejuensis (strain KCTC 2396) TaxID=349521 RepID=Q2SPG4_HAHCH|nr:MULTISPECIES: HU family DNA-binding protein [Hahella]ABC27460.1 Bacterial nucleoid DNA-binding protein [Hahella chejuensis KCTC 2396]AZZ90078.1 HU family DNA-binding protein [Hahella sp. KA22]MBU6954153.1 HU family DNA-binding protein [Hahella sp. HN01]MDG9668759.1 HU family DNA-binding protein [Hahella sp. CR1]QAY53448.1 HU family DNA-binding protein [Hahella sp. KA22]